MRQNGSLSAIRDRTCEGFKGKLSFSQGMVRNAREEWKVREKVFDAFTDRLLFRLASQGHFTELKRTISPGKEAVVFGAEHARFGKVAVKIYLLQSANFHKMKDYLQADPRTPRLAKGAVGDPRRRTIFSWAEREFRNLLLAREARVRSPMPIVQRDHVLVMEYIGDEEPAPLLKHAIPENPEEFAKETFEQLTRLTKAGFAHGDLSEYNILNQNEKPVFIDFSHTQPIEAPGGKELLERDLENISRYFEKLGVETQEMQEAIRAAF